MSAASMWAQDFDEALTEFAQSGEPFTSEDLTDLAGLPERSAPNSNNAVGVRVRIAAKRGLIRKTGRLVPGRNPQSNGRELREWIGA